jgi:hypothetical protein
MTYPEQCHERAGGRKRERGGKQSWTMDTGVDAKRRDGSYREQVCAIAADEPDGALPRLEYARLGDRAHHLRSCGATCLSSFPRRRSPCRLIRGCRSIQTQPRNFVRASHQATPGRLLKSEQEER